MDARLRHAKEVIEQVFDLAARFDADRAKVGRTSIYRLEIMRELAFDVAVAADALSRDQDEADSGEDASQPPTLRTEALAGLKDAKTVLQRLMDFEASAEGRLSAPWSDETARRA